MVLAIEERFRDNPPHVTAVVTGSYSSKYGGEHKGRQEGYTLLFTGSGAEISWFYLQELEFCSHVGDSAIDRINKEREERDKKQGDWDWILTHWDKIKTSPPPGSMRLMMESLGITNPWGSHGEGMAYYGNMIHTLDTLTPVLNKGSKQELMEFLSRAQKPSKGYIYNYRIGD